MRIESDYPKWMLKTDPEKWGFLKMWASCFYSNAYYVREFAWSLLISIIALAFALFVYFLT